MMCLCQGWEAAVSFAFRSHFCIRKHRPSLEQTLKLRHCGARLPVFVFGHERVFVLWNYARIFISCVLGRYAVCEALAEQIMVVGGKLAGDQPHWLALRSPAPELPWPLVQSLLLQQRVFTHVQTPVQNGMLNASRGSCDGLPQEYLNKQTHGSPSESSRNSGRSFSARVFVSTLPKTQSEVGIFSRSSSLQVPSLSSHSFFRQKLERRLPCGLCLAPSMMAILLLRQSHLVQVTSAQQQPGRLLV